MIDINLIENRIVLPKRKKESLLFFLTILAVLFFFSFSVFMFIYLSKRKTITACNRTLQQEQDLILEHKKRLFAFSAEEQKWKEELAEVSALEERTLLYNPKLSALANLMPGYIYLTKISFEEEQLILEGEGPLGNATITALAAFVEQINEDESFREGLSEMKLDWVQEGKKIFSFRIIGKRL